MAIEFRARYANGALVPLEPLDLEEGAEALVTVLAAAPPPGSGEAREVGEEAGAYAAAAPTKATRDPEEMRRIIDEVFRNNPRPKDGGGFSAYVRWVQEIQNALPPEAWEGGPTDLAMNKKHYLYGHPKEED